MHEEVNLRLGIEGKRYVAVPCTHPSFFANFANREYNLICINYYPYTYSLNNIEISIIFVDNTCLSCVIYTAPQLHRYDQVRL